MVLTDCYVVVLDWQTRIDDGLLGIPREAETNLLRHRSVTGVDWFPAPLLRRALVLSRRGTGPGAEGQQQLGGTREGDHATSARHERLHLHGQGERIPPERHDTGQREHTGPPPREPRPRCLVLRGAREPPDWKVHRMLRTVLLLDRVPAPTECQRWRQREAACCSGQQICVSHLVMHLRVCCDITGEWCHVSRISTG